MISNLVSDTHWKGDKCKASCKIFPKWPWELLPGCLEKNLAKTPPTDHIPKGVARPKLNFPWRWQLPLSGRRACNFPWAPKSPGAKQRGSANSSYKHPKDIQIQYSNSQDHKQFVYVFTDKIAFMFVLQEQRGVRIFQARFSVRQWGW